MQCEWPFEEYSPRSTNHTHKTISIPRIRTDGGTQPRAKLNQKTVDEYAQLMAEGLRFDPVTVFYDGTDYWLADGFHRIPAAQKAGFSTIEANIRPGTLREAILYSVAANNKNAEKLTNRDKRRSVLKLLSDPEWSQWTNSEIARQCGVAESFVRKIKEELSSHYATIDQKYSTKCGVDQQVIIDAQQWLEAQPQERIVQRQGTTYTLNTAKCGRSKSPASARNADKQAEPTTLENSPLLLESSPEPVAKISSVSDISAVTMPAQKLPLQPLLEENQPRQLASTQTMGQLEARGHFAANNALKLPNPAFDQTKGAKACVEIGETNPFEELPKNQLRVTNVEWEDPYPLNQDQTLKTLLRIWVKGPSHVLPALFEQIRGNPDLTDLICNEFSNSLEAIAELVS